MATIHDYIRSNAKPALERAGVFDKNITSTVPLRDFSIDDIARRMAENNSLAVRSLKQKKQSLGIDINQYSETLRGLKSQIKEVEDQLTDTANIPKSLLIKKAELKKIFDKLYINHVEYVPNGVTIFTTDFFLINVHDQGWVGKRKIPLGWFRIWIDWNETRPKYAIRVYNFYQRYSDYDHPCISNSLICMGTAATQIEEAFKSKNLFSLLEVIISFLMSEDIHNGYVRSWKVWLDAATKVPQNRQISDYGIRPVNTNRITATEIEELQREYTFTLDPTRMRSIDFTQVDPILVRQPTMRMPISFVPEMVTDGDNVPF